MAPRPHQLGSESYSTVYAEPHHYDLQVTTKREIHKKTVQQKS